MLSDFVFISFPFLVLLLGLGDVLLFGWFFSVPIYILYVHVFVFLSWYNRPSDFTLFRDTTISKRIDYQICV